MKGSVLKQENGQLLEEKVVNLDFVRSMSIHDIEKGIKRTYTGVVLSKKAICIALANIKRYRLFEQLGIYSFKKYINSSRLNMNYKTAAEYAIIGESLVTFSDELKEIEFKEEDGLKKLVLLHKAVMKQPENKQLLIQNLKDTSLRKYQALIANNREEPQEEKEKDFTFRIDVDESRIYMNPDNVDILWINFEFNKLITTPEASERLLNHLKKSLQEYVENKL